MVFNQSEKLKIICSLVILFTAAVMLIGGASNMKAEGNNEPQAALINPEVLEFRENPSEPFYGYIHQPMDLSHLDKIPVERPQKAAALPSSFDWRARGKVTCFVLMKGGC